MKKEMYYSESAHFALSNFGTSVVAARYSDKTGKYIPIMSYDNQIEEVIEWWSSLGFDDWQLIYSESENS